MIARPRESRPRRRGVTLILALVLLGLVAGLGASLVRGRVTARRAADQSRRDAQTLWLVQAGLSKARARLAATAEYAGETWEIPAEELDGRHPGRVVIAIERSEDRPADLGIAVRAIYPADEELTRSARSRRVIHTPLATGRPAPGDQP